jgi:hypothetical protein
MSSGILESEDFQTRQETFDFDPENYWLDGVTKRKVTICNLFANHRMSIPDVVRVLNEKYADVVETLIDSKLIYDRRKTRHQWIKVERRQSYLKSGSSQRRSVTAH